MGVSLPNSDAFGGNETVSRVKKLFKNFFALETVPQLMTQLDQGTFLPGCRLTPASLHFCHWENDGLQYVFSLRKVELRT